MAVQKRNDELVDMLGADFQKRCESSFSWKTACSMIQGLTALRGFWPMSAFDSSGNAIDLSGQNRTLTYNGNPVYHYESLSPYIAFDGTGDYLSRLDEAGLDITGTETYVVAAQRGLTLGGWFYPQNIAAAQALISKLVTAGNYSYELSLRGDVANDPAQFNMSDDGVNTSNVQSSVAYTANTWQFIAGRFCDAKTNEELAVWINDTQTTAVTGRPSIFAGANDFAVGGKAGGTVLYTGRASLVFLCASALADATVWSIFQHTRSLFGV